MFRLRTEKFFFLDFNFFIDFTSVSAFTSHFQRFLISTFNLFAMIFNAVQ